MSIEAGLKTLLDHGSAGAAIVGADGRYVFATRDYEDAHGLTTGSMVGATDGELLPPDAAAVRGGADRAARDRGRARFTYELAGLGRVSGDVLALEDDNGDGDGDGARLGIVLRPVEPGDLHEAEELRRRLLDAERRGRIGTWVWELPDGHVRWSEELSRIHGREHRDEPLTLEEILAAQHPRDREAFGEQLKVAAATGAPFAFEHRIITTDHRLRWMSCQGTADLDDDGRPVRLRGTDQDITERRVVRHQLSRVSRRNQLLLESVSEGIIGLDRAGTVTFANSAALRMLRRSREDLHALVPTEVVALPGGAPDGDRAHPITLTLNGGDEHHVERALVLRPDADPLPVDFTCTALSRAGARVEGAVVALRDRSLRERYEQRIAEAVSELAEAHAHRRRLLADLVAAQEQERRRIAGEIHDDAVQAMSAVALRVEQLADTLDPVGAGHLHRLQDVVHDATGRLRQLLVQLQPPELETAVGAAIEAYVVAASLPFALDVDDDLDEQPSMATRIVLYRIAQEALRNAAKHARAASVRVDLRRVDERVRMTIADDGVGIEDELLRLAQPGHLGIDTMRYRAELAGGRCELRSATGAGTTVVVELPHQEQDA